MGSCWAGTGIFHPVREGVPKPCFARGARVEQVGLWGWEGDGKSKNWRQRLP